MGRGGGAAAAICCLSCVVRSTALFYIVLIIIWLLDLRLLVAGPLIGPGPLLSSTPFIFFSRGEQPRGGGGRPWIFPELCWPVSLGRPSRVLRIPFSHTSVPRFASFFSHPYLSLALRILIFSLSLRFPFTFRLLFLHWVVSPTRLSLSGPTSPDSTFLFPCSIAVYKL